MQRKVLIKFILPVLVLFFTIGWTIQCHSQSALFVPAPGSPFTVGSGSGELILADLNRDGHLDLLSKHLLSQIIDVRSGDGKGHLASAPESSMKLDYGPGAIA